MVPAADSRDPTDCKVGRLLEERGLDGLGAELARRWRGEGVERTSLRDLATLFNRRLVRDAMEDAGLNPLPDEVEAARATLAGERPEDVRVRRCRRLERDGVDVDSLAASLVTHQAVHTYLTKYRGVTHDGDGADDPVSTAVDTVERLRSRATAVTRSTVERLSADDDADFHAGGADVVVSVRVFCPDCETEYDAAALLERGGCDCQTGSDDGR